MIRAAPGAGRSPDQGAPGRSAQVRRSTAIRRFQGPGTRPASAWPATTTSGREAVRYSVSSMSARRALTGRYTPPASQVANIAIRAVVPSFTTQATGSRAATP
jgi:hypothetical protein